jgi:ubiquinone/menaquinone biosynthesis C-methylase UbiE
VADSAQYDECKKEYSILRKKGDKMNPINIYQRFFDSSALARNLITRQYYQFVATLLNKSEMTFMNYGYTDQERCATQIRLEERDEPNRLQIQLYHHLASAVDIDGKDVLEISCGRGGGAAFINQYYHPRSVVGIDRTAQAIKFCRRKHHGRSLTFLEGDAEDIVFGDDSFDIIINVEASHLYGRVDIFLREAFRVLRQGGYLLVADKRTKSKTSLLYQQIQDSRFLLIKQTDISANILESIRQQRIRRIRALAKVLPHHLTWLAIRLVGADGSHLANAIAKGETAYLSFILQKM